MVHRRVDWRSTTFEPNQAHYNALTSLILNSSALEAMKPLSNGTIALGIQPISSSVIKEGRARGSNALGLSPVNQTWFVIDSGSSFSKDDAVIHSTTREIIEGIEENSRTEGVYLEADCVRVRVTIR